jgi:phage-related minor tail protein
MKREQAKQLVRAAIQTLAAKRSKEAEKLYEEIIDNVCDMIKDGHNLLRSKSKLMIDLLTGKGSEWNLDQLAEFCDKELAWDSSSFLRAMGIQGGDDYDTEESMKAKDWAKLKKANGGKEFKYPLDGWST